MNSTDSHEPRKSTWRFGCSSDLAPSDISRYKRAQAVLLLWVAVLATTAVILRQWGPEPGLLVYAVTAIPGLVMVAGFLLYGDFLRKADELTRKIQTEGMAVGFAVGLVFNLSYSLLEKFGAPELSKTDTVILMVVAAVIVIQWQQRKYR